MTRFEDQSGAALLIAIMVVLLFGAVAGTAALTARIETLIAANYRQGREALYVAEGALSRAIQDLSSFADWTPVLGGTLSTFTQGSATGPRLLPGGDTVVLCCGAGSLTAELQQRGLGGSDWGADTPQWRPYAWGASSAWLAAGPASPYFIAVWVADDADGDGNPAIDSNGRVIVHALALGPGRARRSLQAGLELARKADGSLVGHGASIVWIGESRW
jgi:hypothetical protein